MPKSDDLLKAQLARLTPAKKRKARTTATRTAPAVTGKAGKVSVSLYPADHERIRAIVRYLADHGHVVSASRAMQLAVRTAPIGPQLETALAEIHAQDGRRRDSGR